MAPASIRHPCRNLCSKSTQDFSAFFRSLPSLPLRPWSPHPTPLRRPPQLQRPRDPVTFSIYERARNDNWQWFAAPPSNDSYSYLQSLLRISVAQRIHHWDWQAELAQAWVGGVPSDSVAPVSAQGQLGLGGTYYAANGNNTEPAAAFFKQGFLRYTGAPDKSLRARPL